MLFGFIRVSRANSFTYNLRLKLLVELMSGSETLIAPNFHGFMTLFARPLHTHFHESTRDTVPTGIWMDIEALD